MSSDATTPESSPLDVSMRPAVLLLLGSAIIWLILGGTLALISSIQLHTPEFLAACPFFTYGHVRAAQETALIYGWALNSGLGVALWLLARLGGVPLRAMYLALVGAVFWNLAVTLGVVGILAGGMTGFSLLQPPANIQPLLFIAYAAIAAAGVLAWTGRRTPFVFAAQYYAVAALFVFPWVFSVAQILLLFAPVHGTLQSVVAAWFGQSFTALVLGSFALAAAYYLLPKISGRAVNHYDYAPHAFWTLLFIGSWAGGRHLIGGPVPAWVATTGIITTLLLLFHYVVVAINLAGAFRPSGSNVLRFIAVGLTAYLLGGLLNAVTSIRSVAQLVQFTFITAGESHLFLVGAFYFMIVGAIYFIVPRLAGKPWPSAALIRAHFFAAVLGLVVTVAGLFIAGWVQGHDLAQPAVSFAAIAEHTQPWLFAATAGHALFLIGSLAFAANFVRLLSKPSEQPAEALFRAPGFLEAPTS